MDAVKRTRRVNIIAPDDRRIACKVDAMAPWRLAISLLSGDVRDLVALHVNILGTTAIIGHGHQDPMAATVFDEVALETNVGGAAGSPLHTCRVHGHQ